MTRARLPWLLALPLIVGGTLAAHTIGYAAPPAPAEKRELAEAHERLSAGYAGHSVM